MCNEVCAQGFIECYKQKGGVRVMADENAIMYWMFGAGTGVTQPGTTIRMNRLTRLATE